MQKGLSCTWDVLEDVSKNFKFVWLMTTRMFSLKLYSLCLLLCVSIILLFSRICEQTKHGCRAYESC
jgi:hypothetical protein